MVGHWFQNWVFVYEAFLHVYFYNFIFLYAYIRLFFGRAYTRVFLYSYILVFFVRVYTRVFLYAYIRLFFGRAYTRVFCARIYACIFYTYIRVFFVTAREDWYDYKHNLSWAESDTLPRYLWWPARDTPIP